MDGRIAGAVLVALVAGCSHDVVLPDHEVSAPNAACADGGGCGDASIVGTAKRAGACDLSGFWAIRETTYLRDQVFDAVQVSSNWYLYEVAQAGDTFSLTASLDCGVHVTGSATIDYPPASQKALVWTNAEDGTDATRGPRTGTSTASSGGCEVTMGPWFFVRGVTDAYLPPAFGSDPPLSTLPALPSVTDPIDGDDFPVGATDPTTPGVPGIGTLVSGLAPGERYAAQRSTTSFTAGTHVASSALTLVLNGTFDVDENVLRVTGCGEACSLLTTLAVPATDLPPHSTWQFLGTTLGTPSVAAVVEGKPRADVTTDLATCANVVALLPHDATVPTSP